MRIIQKKLATHVCFYLMLSHNACFASPAPTDSVKDSQPVPSPKILKWESAPPPPTHCLADRNSLPDVNPAVLLSMRHRDVELNAWALKLVHERTTIDIERKTLATQLAALKHFQQHLENLQNKQDKFAFDKQKALAQTYELMRPHDAAQIFHNLDENLVVHLLGSMDNRHAAAILALMTVSDARAATEGLAGIALTTLSPASMSVRPR